MIIYRDIVSLLLDVIPYFLFSAVTVRTPDPGAQRASSSAGKSLKIMAQHSILNIFNQEMLQIHVDSENFDCWLVGHFSVIVVSQTIGDPDLNSVPGGGVASG